MAWLRTAWFLIPDADASPMERRLYLARKQFERMHEAGELTGYICSLSIADACL